MNEALLKSRLFDAMKNFQMEDGFLLENGLHERTLTFRLGYHLNQVFKDDGYHVDCEYNRFEIGEEYVFKRLASKGVLAMYEELNEKKPKNDYVSVYPDIIVHQRGPTGTNLLVIEAKRAGSSELRERFDREKLKAYKEELGLAYSYAVFIKFPATNRPLTEDDIEFI